MKILAILVVFVFILPSCGGMHDAIYGEQIIEIKNHRTNTVRIVIESANKIESKTLGEVGANATRTFKITWRNDCYFFFYAYSGDLRIASTGEIDTCGGTSWDIH